MAANGLRAGSGFTVGLLGAVVGVHWSLGLSSAAMCAGTVLAAIYVYWGPRRPAMLDTQTATPQQERT